MILRLLILPTFLHCQAIPVCDLLALEKENYEALHHITHFFHDLESSLVRVASTPV